MKNPGSLYTTAKGLLVRRKVCKAEISLFKYDAMIGPLFLEYRSGATPGNSIVGCASKKIELYSGDRSGKMDAAAVSDVL